MSEEAPVTAANGISSAPPAEKSEPVKDVISEALRQPAKDEPKPHPIFVTILVGPNEVSFGIQKDFLCARSSYYRNHFKANSAPERLENIVKLPNTSAEVFGLTQHFLFTGQVSDGVKSIPSYEALIGVWKLGHEIGIDGLCDKALEVMVERRRVTQQIPVTPLLVQVWRDIPEGSTIRKLLLSWAAEYMRFSESRAEFAKSLPQEVLSELVVAMSSLDNLVAGQSSSAANSPPSTEPSSRKSVHYLEEETDEEHQTKKSRRASAPLPSSQNSKPYGRAPPPPVRKAAAAAAVASAPKPKHVVQKRRSMPTSSTGEISTEKKVEFCSDLLERMLSGPGFWTRLVGPFKEPVDPAEDGVPDYLEKIKNPMDLNTIKAKMSRGEYNTEVEFAADVRQIFNNCYTYWKKGDPMWVACEKFQKTFEEKYSQMHKNITKMMREPID